MSKHLGLAVLLVVVAGCKDKPAAAPAAGRPTGEPVVAGDEADRRFWAWFGAHAKELHDEPELQRAMETVSAEIEKAHAGVFGEIAVDGAERTLVITADGIKDRFPAVQALVAARPADLPGWKVVAFRQRDPHAGSMRIEMGATTLDPTTLRFVAAPHGATADLTVFVPGFTTSDQMGQPLFVVLDHVVGELDMETRIAGIDFAPIEQAPAAARPLLELPALLDKLPAK